MRIGYNTNIRAHCCHSEIVMNIRVNFPMQYVDDIRGLLPELEITLPQENVPSTGQCRFHSAVGFAKFPRSHWHGFC